MMPIKISNRKSKSGFWIKFHKEHQDQEKEIKELFIGRRTIVSLLSITVGGIFVGRSLWQISYTKLGLTYTITIGIIMFLYGGIVLHNFYD